jgi:hypothetical protein
VAGALDHVEAGDGDGMPEDLARGRRHDPVAAPQTRSVGDSRELVAERRVEEELARGAEQAERPGADGVPDRDRSEARVVTEFLG